MLRLSFPLPTLPRPILVICGLAMLIHLAACGSTGIREESVVLAEPVAEVGASEAHPSSSATVARVARSDPRPRANVLTAGDVDDTLNLPAFNRFLQRAMAETGLSTPSLGAPFALQVINGATGQPAPGLRVTLSHGGRVFYDGYSGVDGNVTVFPATRGAKGASRATLKVFGLEFGQTLTEQTMRAGVARHTVRVAKAGGWDPQFLDMAFMVDTTGSMADELDWLTKDLARIVRRAKARAPGVDIRYGLVLYRDHGDAYVVRNMGFTKNLSTMRRWLRAQQASGGGDYPEAAAAALESAVALNWRRGQGERLLFHIADAPPHARDAGRYLRAARAGAAKNIQIFGLGASGVALESEYLMRQAAAMSEGRYLFLTDDSGVGYAHAEPTVSCYVVTQLSGLMARVIGSELSGQRIEPAPDSIIRRVGSYDRGVCRD